MKYEVTLILEYPNAEPQDRIKHETFKDIELRQLNELIPDQGDINVLGITARHIPLINGKE
tara:strand:+ start:233 stop:415 length:183 start_codon:yes stop_codon:yes gene_type:complete